MDKVECDIVALEARKTYKAIRDLRKSTHAFTRTQKDKLASDVKAMEDNWWNRMKPYFAKDNPLWDKDGNYIYIHKFD